MLTGLEIGRQIARDRIYVTHFNEEHINPNSYDVMLGDELRCYYTGFNGPLDPKNPPRTYKYPREEGKDYWILYPGKLYLGHTIEAIGSGFYIPSLNGKSSLGRLGVTVHVTAGFGDIGFKQQWTLEIIVVEPTILYPGMRIAQVCFEEPVGKIKLYDGKYTSQKGAQPSIPYKE